MKKILFAVIALMIPLWPFSASAASPCDDAPQGDRYALSRCIDELRKEVERNRSEIETLKTKNTLISKQLCMVAIEQHRRNANSEALELIIEEACVQFKKPTAPDKRS
jgi:hypothetical protein